MDILTFIFKIFSTADNIFYPYYIIIELVLCSLTLLLQCWRKSRFRTEQWARSTSSCQGCTDSPRYLTHNVLCLKVQEFALSRRTEDASMYNIHCVFPMELISGGGGTASSHPEANTVWKSGSDLYANRRTIVYFIKEHSTIMQYETSQLLFCAVSYRKYCSCFVFV